MPRTNMDLEVSQEPSSAVAFRGGFASRRREYANSSATRRRLPFMCSCRDCRAVEMTLLPPRVPSPRLDYEDFIPPMQLPPPCSPVSEPEEWLLSLRYKNTTMAGTTPMYSEERHQSPGQTQQPTRSDERASRIGDNRTFLSTNAYTSTRMERTISQPYRGRLSHVPSPVTGNHDLDAGSNDYDPECNYGKDKYRDDPSLPSDNTVAPEEERPAPTGYLAQLQRILTLHNLAWFPRFSFRASARRESSFEPPDQTHWDL
ncbi:hypothetical protein G7Z17_g11804 [Cylindrodendrum hubeiense]|uniref:Uncharacterized protein n=1 Tax=Cylindrodendrum hubeiense TaxID=595255 RepID=A0A9P5H039_9HYPO|nr:hypothetical protein G7Z17_g11804 [Cylindrodendrum hubeiense]